jgi:uncharacterized protein (TIGR00251 family)
MSRAEESGVGEWDRLAISERAEGIRILVQVRPRSSRSAVLGVRDTALEVALTAPPADGAANAELIKLLARIFDVRRGDIAVGTSSRSKVIAIHGLDAVEARARLGRARR